MINKSILFILVVVVVCKINAQYAILNPLPTNTYFDGLPIWINATLSDPLGVPSEFYITFTCNTHCGNVALQVELPVRNDTYRFIFSGTPTNKTMYFQLGTILFPIGNYSIQLGWKRPIDLTEFTSNQTYNPVYIVPFDSGTYFTHLTSGNVLHTNLSITSSLYYLSGAVVKYQTLRLWNSTHSSKTMFIGSTSIELISYNPLIIRRGGGGGESNIYFNFSLYEKSRYNIDFTGGYDLNSASNYTVTVSNLLIQNENPVITQWSLSPNSIVVWGNLSYFKLNWIYSNTMSNATIRIGKEISFPLKDGSTTELILPDMINVNQTLATGIYDISIDGLDISGRVMSNQTLSGIKFELYNITDIVIVNRTNITMTSIMITNQTLDKTTNTCWKTTDTRFIFIFVFVPFISMFVSFVARSVMCTRHGYFKLPK